MRVALEKIAYTAFRVCRIVCLFFALMVMSAVTDSVERGVRASLQGSALAFVSAVLLSLLFFLGVYSAIRFFALYDKHYVAKYGKEEASFLFLRRWEFWLFLIGTATLTFVSPLPFVISPLFTKSTTLLWHVALAFDACLVPLFLFSHRSAEKVRGKMKDPSQALGTRTLAARLFLLVFSYSFACGGFSLLFRVLSAASVWEGLGNKIFIVVALLLAAFLIPLYLRALLKRRSFLKKLKALCAKKKYKLSEIRKPFLSLFKETAGASFTVKADGKTYTCKLCGGINRGTAVLLGANGEGSKKYTFYFGRHFGRRNVSVELFSLCSYFDYSMETDGTKVLVFTNVPRRIIITEGKRTFLADSGDEIDGYKVYGASDFLAALERDTVTRSTRDKDDY